MFYYPDRDWFEKIDLLVSTRREDETRTMCMEECAELVQAISKVMRAKTDAEKNQARTNLLAEIADVLISIDLLQVTEEIGSDEIMTAVDEKMVRNLARIGGDGK